MTNSTEPLVISNRYSFTAKQLAHLRGGEMLRKAWYFVIILVGFLVISTVRNVLKDPSLLNWIFPPLVLMAVWFLVGFRFISRLNNDLAVRSSIFTSVFSDRIESEYDEGGRSSYAFIEIKGMKIRRKGYVIHLKDRRAIYIPLNCFKSAADKNMFEETLKAL